MPSHGRFPTKRALARRYIALSLNHSVVRCTLPTYLTRGGNNLMAPMGPAYYQACPGHHRFPPSAVFLAYSALFLFHSFISLRLVILEVVLSVNSITQAFQPGGFHLFVVVVVAAAPHFVSAARDRQFRHIG